LVDLRRRRHEAEKQARRRRSKSWLDARFSCVSTQGGRKYDQEKTLPYFFVFHFLFCRPLSRFIFHSAGSPYGMDGGLLAPLCPPRQGPQDPGPVLRVPRLAITAFHDPVLHFPYPLFLSSRCTFSPIVLYYSYPIFTKDGDPLYGLP